MRQGSNDLTSFGGHSPSGALCGPRTSTVEGFEPPDVSLTVPVNCQDVQDAGVPLFGVDHGHGHTSPAHPVLGVMQGLLDEYAGRGGEGLGAAEARAQGAEYGAS